MTTQTTARPGRNDPCRCGSGKKYKQCCLEKDDKKAAAARATAATAEEAPATLGAKPGASQIFIFTDGDDPAGIVDPNDINNWPDSRTDNHANEGSAFTFCDGHSEFVKQQRVDYVWSVSHNNDHKASTGHP